MAAAASIGADSTGYIWEDPGDSIMIQISLDVVERLGAAVEQGLGAGARGTEVGGILLGRTLPGFGRAVLVEDFELTPCEHLRGASYTLSPKDRRILGSRLERRSPQSVVGYFRSHTRPGMYLDQDDFAVFSQHFPEAWQVFLLVKPSKEGLATGGFFFWEDGEVDRRSTYRQFPFDAARLIAGNYPITGEKNAVPVPRSAPGLAPVLMPKPEVRAPRRLPSLPWIVVPVIGGLFLIAGLFVSGNQTPVTETPAAKVTPPVEPLLPEPTPRAASPLSASSQNSQTPVNAATPAADHATPAEPSPPKPQAKAVAKPITKPVRKAVPPGPVSVAHVPVRELEQPPALAVPVARIEAKAPAVLPSHVTAAPPLEAEVSFEPAHAGVFKRALHKIEGDQEPGAFVAASPIRRVSPAKPADAGGADLRPVDVKVSIDESGIVTHVQLLTKGSFWAPAAMAAARQWQFKPARKHDKPVSSEMVLHFHF